ncbi:ChrR family anti-sigma-E factor [Psychrobium sp. 1_MG-2023]|uniref:ChrR family anti-sigma-E factor n=1 Tax=Psychrobium sp. 1_MG-2023 TaxID=3062624 RepID=UPI000C327CCC|nr:ChrR family anti-sigma-E factor [Psychrobium sp. 1_MG-2023]MDP2562158.1 ChrR family anti-sigma-E factor [Psychrobium sp. 1_MG-2023]PKF57170.1 transcriptional regulator [Alteromonadales bacterium alter-6D02]
MIKHHPTFELLKSYVAGDLPASLSAGIAMHAQMCSHCQQQIALLTDEAASVLEADFSPSVTTERDDHDFDSETFDFEQMIGDITASTAREELKAPVEKTITFNNKTYPLPLALNNMVVGKSTNIGKLSRARVQLNEEEIHTSLLHIEPGGGVPEHTHKGFELTLLLDGSFEDEQGKYVKGDFIMLDGRHQHNPISTEGCLCYTVANDALRFTQGINKLLNPIGTFIY